jgi:hypothetical protein
VPGRLDEIDGLVRALALAQNPQPRPPWPFTGFAMPPAGSVPMPQRQPSPAPSGPPGYRPTPWMAGRVQPQGLDEAATPPRDSFQEFLAQMAELPGMTPEERREATMRLLGGNPAAAAEPPPSGPPVPPQEPQIELPPEVGLDPELTPPQRPQAASAPPRSAAQPPMIAPPLPRPERAPEPPQSDVSSLALDAPEPSAEPMGLQQVAQQKIAEDAAKDGAPEWALPLIMAGLSMAANSSKGLLEAAAEGGIAGVNALYMQRRQNREDARLDLAGKREERQLEQGERRLSIEEQNAKDLAAYRRESTALDREKLGISQAESAADRAYKNNYLDYLKSRSGEAGRAPTRPEQFQQIYEGFAAKLPPDQALSAARDLWSTIYAGGGSSPLEKLQSDPDYWMLTPEERAAIEAEIGGGGGMASDPTDQFFEQLLQQRRGMPGSMGFE